MQRKSILFIVGFGLTFFGMQPLATSAFSRTGIIEKAYRDMLDRVPKAEERTSADAPSMTYESLAQTLNQAPERDRALAAIYRYAFRRRPRPLELTQWKEMRAPLNKVRKALFTSDERRVVLTDLYLNALGRYPRDHEVAFYAVRRIAVETIRRALSASTERRDAIIQQFERVLGRQPEDVELAYFISSGQDLDRVGQNSRPVAHAGTDQMVPNDTTTVQLDGSASADLEGDVVSYTWSAVETPPDAAVTIVDASAPRPLVVFSASADDPLYRVPGLYRFRLIVSDGLSRSESDEVEVTVLVSTSYETQLFDAVVGLRNASGATSTPALLQNDVLTRVARRYSRYLFVNNWFESTDRDGKTSADRVRAEGSVFKRVGENIALIKSKSPIKVTKKRVKDIFDGWYESAEHKQNMMHPEYTETGIGFFMGRVGPNDYRIYATQVFIVPPPPPSTPPPTPTATPVVNSPEPTKTPSPTPQSTSTPSTATTTPS